MQRFRSSGTLHPPRIWLVFEWRELMYGSMHELSEPFSLEGLSLSKSYSQQARSVPSASLLRMKNKLLLRSEAWHNR